MQAFQCACYIYYYCCKLFTNRLLRHLMDICYIYYYCCKLFTNRLLRHLMDISIKLKYNIYDMFNILIRNNEQFLICSKFTSHFLIFFSGNRINKVNICLRHYAEAELEPRQHLRWNSL